ncbi:hypothetical protein D3C72_132280 [compost metagenome]
MKLLWGRAANRCSICRIELSQDAGATTASFTLGEQAHIVGENEKSARWKSPLTTEERNSYHNMILLCPNHHTEIDKNEIDWPVERLHIKKSMHELWVRETLSDTADLRVVAKQAAVAAFIDLAVQLADLENWKIWTSWALSPDPKWSFHMPDRLWELRQKADATIWPDEFDEFRRAGMTLAVVLHDAAGTFLEHAQLHEEGVYYPDKFYRNNGNFNPNYDEDLEKYELWQKDCWDLIKKATCAANWFADVVRRDINPTFFAAAGKFGIEDGPFDNGRYYASFPEFTEEAKAGLPDSHLVDWASRRGAVSQSG